MTTIYPAKCMEAIPEHKLLLTLGAEMLSLANEANMSNYSIQRRPADGQLGMLAASS